MFKKALFIGMCSLLQRDMLSAQQKPSQCDAEQCNTFGSKVSKAQQKAVLAVIAPGFSMALSSVALGVSSSGAPLSAEDQALVKKIVYYCYMQRRHNPE